MNGSPKKDAAGSQEPAASGFDNPLATLADLAARRDTLRHEQKTLRHEIETAARAAQAAGHSLAEIGRALGVTKQGARHILKGTSR